MCSNQWKTTRSSFLRLTILELRKFFCSQFCSSKASHCSKYENLKSCWCSLNNRIKIKDYLLQVTPTFYTNLALTPTNGRLSISSFLIYSELLRSIRSIFSIQHIRSIKPFSAIIRSHASFGSFKNSTNCNNPLFSLTRLLPCWPISSTSFFKKSNYLRFLNHL